MRLLLRWECDRYADHDVLHSRIVRCSQGNEACAVGNRLARAGSCNKTTVCCRPFPFWGAVGALPWHLLIRMMMTWCAPFLQARLDTLVRQLRCNCASH